VLTPSWYWHGHANDGSETAFWLDFLDVPFVWHVEAAFFEHRPEAFQRPTQRRSALRIPLGEAFGAGAGTRSVEIAKDVTPTIGMHAIQLPAGDATEKPRETANNIYAVVSDTVRAAIDGQEDEMLGRGDVLAVPLRQGACFVVLRMRPCCADEPIRRSSVCCATAKRGLASPMAGTTTQMPPRGRDQQRLHYGTYR
jgi:gentisate 1,2-dioxygenase